MKIVWDDFEAGVRFAKEAQENYSWKEGDKETQFGVYQMSLSKRSLLKGSEEHQKRIIKAYVHLAKTNGIVLSLEYKSEPENVSEGSYKPFNEAEKKTHIIHFDKKVE